MLLSDGSLRKLYAHGDIDIVPEPADVCWQPCSIDLTLGLSYRKPGTAAVMMREYKLHSGEFVLGTTAERVMLRPSFVGMVHGRSTWARRGLVVHFAGLIDPGFNGDITLELRNLGPDPLLLSAGDRICQMTVQRLDWPAVRPYGYQGLQSHYQHQTGATESHTGRPQ